MPWQDLETALADVKDPPYELDTQVKVFFDHLNGDESEFSERFQNKKINFE